LPAVAKGWCIRHYNRNRIHGHPESVSERFASQQEAGYALRWITEMLATKPDGCVFWPFTRSKTGYATGKHRGRTVSIHRMVWEVATGSSIPEGLIVRHSCNRGCDGCVSPACLLLGTTKDNIADKILADRQGGKLKKQDALDIKRLLRAGMQQGVVASFYGVTQANISSIATGKTWAHTGDPS
jgi:hypothetical protein